MLIRVKTGIRGLSLSRRRNRLIVAALFAGLAVSTVRAGTFRCGTHLVRPGDTSFEVLKKCGHPASQQQISGANERFVEQWYYEPGPGAFKRILTFVGNPAGRYRNRDAAVASACRTTVWLKARTLRVRVYMSVSSKITSVVERVGETAPFERYYAGEEILDATRRAAGQGERSRSDVGDPRASAGCPVARAGRR